MSQPHELQNARLPCTSLPPSLLKLMSIESVIPSNHLILCCPLFLLSSIFHSIGVFSNESALHIRWPKYWRFSFSISPSSEGLIHYTPCNYISSQTLAPVPSPWALSHFQNMKKARKMWNWLLVIVSMNST